MVFVFRRKVAVPCPAGCKPAPSLEAVENGAMSRAEYLKARAYPKPVFKGGPAKLTVDVHGLSNGVPTTLHAETTLPGGAPFTVCAVCAGTGTTVEPTIIDADSWADARRYAMILFSLGPGEVESVWRAVNRDPTDVELRWQGSDFGTMGSSGPNCRRQFAIRTRQPDGSLSAWRPWRPEAP